MNSETSLFPKDEYAEPDENIIAKNKRQGRYRFLNLVRRVIFGSLSAV